MEPPGANGRPVLVLSRDVSIPRLRSVMFAPATTNVRGLDTEVILEPGDDPVDQRSALNLDSVGTIDVEHLIRRLGQIDVVKLQAVCAALDVAVDCG